MTLPAGSYLGQVGRFAPLSGLSAAAVHNVAKARALRDAGLGDLGVIGLGHGLGDTIGTILCAGGTAAGGLYTGGSASGSFSTSTGSSTPTSSSWTSGWGTAVADAIGTGIAAAACPPTTAPAPAPAPAPPPSYPAPSIVYVPAPQQQAPLLQPRSSGIDQQTLLIIGGLAIAAIAVVVLLK